VRLCCLQGEVPLHTSKDQSFGEDALLAPAKRNPSYAGTRAAFIPSYAGTRSAFILPSYSLIRAFISATLAMQVLSVPSVCLHRAFIEPS
jgi:hypothetical protein